MSQAEFAKASGWSVSTISSWERGRATPSRLAFKTILAFAEARGVRYSASEPPPGAPDTLPVLRLSSRVPGPEPTGAVLDASPLPAGREESFGSRRWTAVGDDGLGAQSRSRVSISAERAGWKAEADFRLSIGRQRDRGRSGWVAATAALLLGIGVGAFWQTRGASPPARDVDAARDGAGRGAVAAPAPVAALAPGDLAPEILADEPFQPWHETPEFPAPADGAAEGTARAAAVATTFPTARARLESIIALDGIRRASFRVGDRSITLVEGDQLGARAIALIADDEVTLVGAGQASRVRLGLETSIE